MGAIISQVYFCSSFGLLTAPTMTPKAGRPAIDVLPSPMLPGRTVLSEGGMVSEVVSAVLQNFSVRFVSEKTRMKGNDENTTVREADCHILHVPGTKSRVVLHARLNEEPGLQTSLNIDVFAPRGMCLSCSSTVSSSAPNREAGGSLVSFSLSALQIPMPMPCQCQCYSHLPHPSNTMPERHGRALEVAAIIQI